MVYYSDKMEFLYTSFIVLAGFLSMAAGTLTGPDVFGKEKLLFVDPLMVQNCEAKGIQLLEIDQKMEKCIGEATTDFLTRKIVYVDPLDHLTNICGVRIRERVNRCIEKLIDEVKKCYETQADKNNVEKAMDVLDASIEFMCEDNARGLKDVFTNASNLACLVESGYKAGFNKSCVPETLDVDTPEMDLQDACQVVFEMGRCMMEPTKHCDSTRVYEFLRGLWDTSMRVSPCGTYVSHLLSLAAAPSYNLWIILCISFSFLVFSI